MVEITTTAKLRSGRGVIVHHRSYLPTCDVTCREGVQVTTPERTLLDLAAVVPIRALEHAVDSALRQELATLEKLRARLAVLGHSGRNGTTNMRMVLGDRPDGYRATDSPLEDAFMEVVDRHGLPVPVRQRHIQRHGVSIGRFDFLYLEGRIVIELDGYGHHWDRRSFQRDRRRSNELGLEGWLVLRYTWQDVTRRGDVVAAEVRAALAARSKD
jgi:very-short-patch-repair endonuclease